MIAKRLVDQSNLPRAIALAYPEGKPMKYIVFAAAMAASPALGPDTIALLDSFDGTLIVGRDGH